MAKKTGQIIHPVVITVRAPDSTGLVAGIAGAVARAGGNILDVGQHSDVDSEWFGCRLEVDESVDTERLESALNELAVSRGLTWEIHDTTERSRVVIVCSKTLHCVSDLLARVSIGALDGDVVAVVSDYAEAEELARRHGVAFHHVPLEEERELQELALGAVLEELDADLIVLARYMRILPGWLTERWTGSMINIHHSFLPAFAGAGPYARAHERGVKLIGATAHYVTAELDAGPIIAQDVERVSHRDSVEDLIRRGADVERSVLAAAVRLHLENRVMIFGNRTCVFD